MSIKPNNWEEAAQINPEYYIACVPKGKIYKSTGLIDSGNLLYSMREILGYSFINKNIMEYGCGNGRMTEFLRPYFDEYHVCDISETMLNLIKEKIEYINAIKTDGVSILVGNDTIDLLFSFTVLMHNKKENVYKIVDEFYRILKNNSYAFVQLPCYPNSRDIKECVDVALWSKDELKELFKKFEIIRIEAEEQPLKSKISEKHFKYHILKKIV